MFNRGTTKMSRSIPRLVALALLPLLIWSGVSFGAEATSHRNDLVTGRKSAPTIEDHAAYYAESRRNVSPADLKRADDLRIKTIASIRALLKTKTEKSGRNFELLLRLGELYVERHDYLRDSEHEAYGKSWDNWNTAAKASRGKEPKLNVAASTGELQKAIVAFRSLVTEYPKHPRTDAALYSLGKSLGRTGNENSLQYYKQLITSHPNSPLTPDAYLAMGEFYFDKHKVSQAIDSYKSVMKYKDHRAYPYAVYKLGWSYYNNTATNDQEGAENFKKSVSAFKLVVKLADDQRAKAEANGKKQSSNLDLRDEAIKDLVMVWAETEDTDAAWKYFRTIGAEASFYTMLERLGWIYSEHGQNLKAITVYKRLLAESPNRKTNPKIQAKLVELYDLTEQSGSAVATLSDMQKAYLGSTPWTISNRTDDSAVAEASKLVEKTMHRYGALYHSRGQKAKNKAYLSAASSIYSSYLGAFSENPNCYEIRYYLAEIQYDFGKLEAASDNYLIVAKARPKDGKYLKDSSLSAVSAISKLVADTKFEKLPLAGQVTKPIEIPRLKRKMIEVMDEFLVMLPAEKDGLPMRFTASQTYFDYGHYVEALKRFDKLASDYPQTKQGLASAKIVLAYYASKEQWGDVVVWSKKYEGSKALMADVEFKKFVSETLRHASFKKALVLEKAKEFDEAAAAFMTFQKDFPSDPHADRALYNASLNLYKVARIEDAISASKILLEKYPQSEVRSTVLISVAETYESLAQFESAAKYYKAFSDSFPGDKRSAGSLFNAAVLFKGVGNLDLSSQLLAEFIRRYPKHEISDDAQLELARQKERQGKYTDAMDIYGTIAKNSASSRDRALMAAAKSAEIRTFRVNEKAGRIEFDKLRRELSVKNGPAAYEARQIVAASLFKLLETSFNEFKSVGIGSTMIEKQILRKQKMLEASAGEYEQVIGIGSAEYTVASLFRLGEMHENFANALFKSPGPAGATQSDVEKVKTQLEKLGFPLRDEAYKFYETAHRRSGEVETFTQWTKRTYQKMAEIQPQKHPDVVEQSADPSYMSQKVSLNESTSSLAK